MPLYRYQATDTKGKVIKGMVDAASKAAAFGKLRARGFFPTEVVEDLGRGSTGGKVGEALAYTLMQFSSLLKCGIPMDEALGTLSEYGEDLQLRSALRRVQVRLREGESLTGAMAEEEIFPSMLIRMVEAAEEAGRPAEVLGRYAGYLKKDLEHRRALSGALAYPVMLVTLSFLLLVGLLYFLTPVLEEMYSAVGVELPWVTRVIISLGKVVGSWGGIALLAVAVVGFVLWKLVPTVMWDRIKLSLPVLGPLLICGLMERWSSTLGMLHYCGVPLVRALQLSREVLENQALAEQLKMAEQSVERGEGLASALSRVYLLPPLIHQFLKTGERSGELSAMLESAAGFFERELERRRGVLVRYLEPLLVLCMGVVVGFMVLSVLLPLARISADMV